MCGIVGIFRHEGQVSADSRGAAHAPAPPPGQRMVTFDGVRFQERKDNGLVANIFDG